MKTHKNKHTNHPSYYPPSGTVQELPSSPGAGPEKPVTTWAAEPDANEADGVANATAGALRALKGCDPVGERLERQTDYLSRLYNGKIPRIDFHLADGEDISAMIPERGSLVKAWMIDDTLDFIVARMQKNIPWIGSCSIGRIQEYIVHFAEAIVREEMYELREGADLLTEIRLGLQTLQRFLKLMHLHANDAQPEPSDEVTA